MQNILVLFLPCCHHTISSSSDASQLLLIINLAAFHILFAKLDACSNFSGMYLMSFPIVVPESTENLKLSAPYWSSISIGSIPLPKLFLATQKKIISLYLSSVGFTAIAVLSFSRLYI